MWTWNPRPWSARPNWAKKPSKKGSAKMAEKLKTTVKREISLPLEERTRSRAERSAALARPLFLVYILIYIPTFRHLLINDSTPRDYKRRVASTWLPFLLVLTDPGRPTPLFPSRTSDAPHSIFYQLPISVLALPMASPPTARLDLIFSGIEIAFQFVILTISFQRELIPLITVSPQSNRPPVRSTALTDLCVGMFSLLLSDFWCWSCFLHRYNFLRDRTLIDL